MPHLALGFVVVVAVVEVVGHHPLGSVNGFPPVGPAGRLVSFETLTSPVMLGLAALVQLGSVHSMLLDQ